MMATSSSPPQEQLRSPSGAAGNCGATTREGSCTAIYGVRGVLMPTEGPAWSGNASVALRACHQLCDECLRCQFVSFSTKYRDCSWYNECPALHSHPAGFLSFARGNVVDIRRKRATDVFNTRLAAARARARSARYAICLSGDVRSLDRVADRFEQNLVLPNRADVFAHVYFNPANAGEARAVAWLRNASWTKALVTEVYDSRLKQEIIASFPEYDKMQRRDNYERQVRHSSSANRLSMWRKVWLANQLRVEYARRAGVHYTAVVRCRPDLLFETKVELGLYPVGDAAGKQCVNVEADSFCSKKVAKGTCAKFNAGCAAACDPACNVAPVAVWSKGDLFAIGAPNEIDVLASVYGNISRLFADDPNRFNGAYVSEKLLRDHLAEHGIEQRGVDVEEGVAIRIVRTGRQEWGHQKEAPAPPPSPAPLLL